MFRGRFLSIWYDADRILRIQYSTSVAVLRMDQLFAEQRSCPPSLRSKGREPMILLTGPGSAAHGQTAPGRLLSGMWRTEKRKIRLNSVDVQLFEKVFHGLIHVRDER